MGLLGPNGAGKTTTVKAIATLISPESGRVRVSGYDTEKDLRAARLSMGVTFGGEAGLYGRLSAHDNLRYFSSMYPRGAVPPGRIPSLLAQVGLEERQDDLVGTYSRGMKQRLHLARVLLHDPDVLLLDEPSSGLDPAGAKTLRDLVGETLRPLGKAVLLTTHDLRECEHLCDQVLVMSGGQVLAEAAPSALRAAAATELGSRLRVPGRPSEAVLQAAARLGSVESGVGSDLVLFTKDPAGAVASLLAVDNALTISVEEPTLEDAYLRLVVK